MSENDTEAEAEAIELPNIDPNPETGDHPDEVTEEEADAGHRLYLAVDDLDDESTGLDGDVE